MKSNMGNEQKLRLRMQSIDGRRMQLDAVRGMKISSPCPPILVAEGCSQARWNAMVAFYIKNMGVIT